jgi:hypothetical protein
LGPRRTQASAIKNLMQNAGEFLDRYSATGSQMAAFEDTYAHVAPVSAVHFMLVSSSALKATLHGINKSLIIEVGFGLQPSVRFILSISRKFFEPGRNAGLFSETGRYWPCRISRNSHISKFSGAALSFCASDTLLQDSKAK